MHTPGGTDAGSVTLEAFKVDYVTVQKVGTQDARIVMVANCPAGKHVVGGGFKTILDNEPNENHQVDHVNASGPTADGTGWLLDVKLEGDTSPEEAIVTAICATVEPI